MWKRAAVSFFVPPLCVMMVLARPVTAAAADHMPPDRSDYKLVLHLIADHPVSGEELPLEGVRYRLYKVGEFGSVSLTDGDWIYSYTHTDHFEGFLDSGDPYTDLERLDFWGETAEELSITIEKLAAYVADNDIGADYPATTNSAGEAVFSPLTAGLYLALGDPVIKDLGGAPDNTWTFTPQATLVSVPFLEPDPDQQWIFIVHIDVKIKEEPSEPIPVSVRKIWEGDAEHPSSVTVKLLANGAVYGGIDDAVVELNDRNNWSYTWPRLSPAYDWTVQEEVPSGWQAGYTRDGNDFTITNQPSSSSSSSPSSPSPSRFGGGGSSGSGSTSRGPYLPYTGQLWWPVPLLAAVGVLLLLTGAVLFSRKEEPEGPHE